MQYAFNLLISSSPFDFPSLSFQYNFLSQNIADCILVRRILHQIFYSLRKSKNDLNLSNSIDLVRHIKILALIWNFIFLEKKSFHFVAINSWHFFFNFLLKFYTNCILIQSDLFEKILFLDDSIYYYHFENFAL